MESQPVKKQFLPTWAQLAILGVIILLVIKFCPTKPKPQDAQIAALEAQHSMDSVEALIRATLYADTLAKLKKEKERALMQYEHASSDLNKTISLNRELIKKHNATDYSRIVDTSAVLMPCEFVNDCKDCFDRLEKTTDSVEFYRFAADQTQVLFISQASIDSARIDQLEKEKLKLNQQYNDMRISAEVNARSMESTWKIKTGIAGRLNDKFLPNGVGPGIMYEDKKGRDFSVKALFGSGPASYIIDVFVPFSFKNKN
jgi:hypothetical protein